MIIESVRGLDKIVFDEAKHKYWLNGEAVPGVTTINKQGYPKSEALIRWQVKQGIKEYETKEKAQAAADIGTFVHDYAYNVENNNIDEIDRILRQVKVHQDREKIMTAICHFDSWKEDNKDTLMHSEAVVASFKHKYAGKFDRLAERNGKIVLSDFKTSSGIYIDQFLQLAGYAILIKEWLDIKVDAFEVLRFGKKDASFETKLIDKHAMKKVLSDQFIRNVETYYFRAKYDKQ